MKKILAILLLVVGCGESEHTEKVKEKPSRQIVLHNTLAPLGYHVGVFDDDCVRITSLHLNHRARGAGYEYFEGTTRIKSHTVISLANVHQDETTFEKLKHTNNLRWLDLSSTKVTDADLVYLKGMEHLNSLSLRNTNITSNGLVHLSTLKALTHLDLYDTQVSDQGLSHLTALPRLEILVLGWTELSDSSPITDASIEHLESMPSLQEVGLYRTQVTKDGVSELEKALPTCKVTGVFIKDLLTGPEKNNTGPVPLSFFRH